MDRPMLCSANGHDYLTMFIERDGYDICTTVVVQLRVLYPNNSTTPYFKKNPNASKPSEYPSVRGENFKTFRWDHSLQIQNLFTAFNRVPRW